MDGGWVKGLFMFNHFSLIIIIETTEIFFIILIEITEFFSKFLFIFQHPYVLIYLM